MDDKHKQEKVPCLIPIKCSLLPDLSLAAFPITVISFCDSVPLQVFLLFLDHALQVWPLPQGIISNVSKRQPFKINFNIVHVAKCMSAQSTYAVLLTKLASIGSELCSLHTHPNEFTSLIKKMLNVRLQYGSMTHHSSCLLHSVSAIYTTLTYPVCNAGGFLPNT